MRNKLEYPTVFIIGAGATAVWSFFRGHTHWTMYVLGGICLCLIYAISNYNKLTIPENGLYAQWQHVSGVYCRWPCQPHPGLEVWTYSHYPMNILGQVCPLFSLLWLLLCIPICPLCIKLKVVFNKLPPYKRDV